ncbi:MAG: PBP1A family penicillin-binding protein [Treponema sp.]
MRGRTICFYFYLIFIFTVLIAGSATLGILLAQTAVIKQNEQFTAFNPDLPTRILDIRGDLITEFSSDEKREIIRFDQIPPALINALLVREDRSFYQHRGFTVKAIFRAVVGKLTGKSLGGGSTITQQIAGLLYCDRTDMSIKRKVKELWWALQMERRYSKDEILELYLNKVYFGGGTYGVSAACRFYFGHSVAEITPAEAAILVIQLSNPAYYNPFEYPNRAQDRQNYVLDEMVRLGYLSKEEKDESYDEYWAHFDYTRTKSSAWFNREDNARWFSEYVRRQLETMMYGTMDFYSDGYIVHTTCDLRHQAAAEKEIGDYIKIANNRVKNSRTHRFSQNELYSNITALLSLTFNIPALHIDSERVQTKTRAYYRETINPVVDMAAMLFGLNSLKIASTKSTMQIQDELAKKTVEGTLICVENATGYITALVGGSKFDETNQMIRATQGRVQPGSSFKPLLYSAAFDTKLITPATVLEDTPQVFKNQSGVPYIPNNYAGKWQGTVLAWRALAKSLNIPAIKVLDTIGFDAAINRSAALLDITDPDEIERTFPRLYPLALGVISVAPIQMAKAFACFGNEGRRVDPIAIRTVENRNGTIIMDPERDLRLEQRRKGKAMQVISPQNAYIMVSMMQKTITEGTLSYASGSGSKFRYKDKTTGKYFTMPMAGKTGTTQNWSDAWAIGYSPYYTAAVWFGYDKGGQSLGLDNTGATLAGPPWANFMKAIHEDKPYKEFNRPETGLTSVSVCAKSGMLQTEHCNEGTVSLYFLSGTEPTVSCGYHEAHTVLLEIAKNRLRTSSYSAGQTPVDISETGVFLDPRIFEDPEPSKKLRRSGRSVRPGNAFDKNVTEGTASALSEFSDAGTLTVPEEAFSSQPEAGTLETENVDGTQVPDNGLSESVSPPPEPSAPDAETGSAGDAAEKTEETALPSDGTDNTDDDSVIQSDGINPWL